MKIMERTYKSANGVIEKTRYYVGDRAQPRGRRKKGNTGFRKQEQNFNSAVRRLARIFNCNFTHDGGLLIGLDFDDAAIERLRDRSEKRRGEGHDKRDGMSLPQSPAATAPSSEGALGAVRGKECGQRRAGSSRPTGTEIAEMMDLLREEADREGALYWRRLKCKLGNDIKVVLVTSDMDGDTGEIARVHCHIVLQTDKSVSWDMLKELWPNGTVDIKQLRQQADYSKLAAYLMRQVRHQTDKKKYRVSRGMQMPVTEEREIAFMSEIRTPPGAQVFERRFAVDESSQYVRYLPKKKTVKIGGHKGGGACGI